MKRIAWRFCPILISSSVRCTLEDSKIISHSVTLKGKADIEKELSLKRTSTAVVVDEFKVLSQIWKEGIEENQEISLSR